MLGGLLLLVLVLLIRIRITLIILLLAEQLWGISAALLGDVRGR